MSDILNIARASALFLAPINTTDPLTAATATAAIRTQLHLHRGVRGVAADVAVEFGDHPEVAVRRMTWALATVRDMYPPIHPVATLRTGKRIGAAA